MKAFNFKKPDGIEGVDFVKCLWCGAYVKRIYGIHMKVHHPGKSSKDYKKEFGDDTLLTSSKDRNNTTKNAGLHMKKEKYRKMARDRALGNKNPNHSSKTSKKQRQERSPFSKHFTKYTDDTERIEFIKNALKDRITTASVYYWLNKGMKLCEAIKTRHERQITFSLDICIKKYGEEEGIKIWSDRQTKWLKNFKRSNFSQISQDMFKEIMNEIGPRDDMFFAVLNKNKEIDTSGKNHELRLKLKNKTVLPDFIILNDKKIIEFDGTYWHAKRKEHDKERDALLSAEGFTVLHISEKEFRKRKEKTIKKCLTFITEST